MREKEGLICALVIFDMYMRLFETINKGTYARTKRRSKEKKHSTLRAENTSGHLVGEKGWATVHCSWSDPLVVQQHLRASECSCLSQDLRPLVISAMALARGRKGPQGSQLCCLGLYILGTHWLK